MKSSLINSIGEVVTDYGARVMKVFKKGLLGRSLFDFYGDIKADTLRTNESSAAPGTPADGKGGVIYTKSADGKLYYKSNEVAEVELSANGGHTDEDIEDIAGNLVATGGTKTGIAITYDDANGDMDFVVDHDAATNFVAEEHYRWDNDIQSTATINHLNLSSDTPGETEVLVMNDGDAVWGHGEKMHIQVRNDEGSTISAGQPLYSKGEIGGSNRILVGVCDANDSAKMPCIGIAHSEMNTTSTKDNFAVVSGIYNTNLSGFTSLAVGDNLYIQDDGSLSQTKPTGEDSLIQNVGIVLRTNGTICQGMLVSAIGRTNDVPNLDQNALFIGNGSNQAVATDAPMVGVITAANAGAARTVLGVDAAGTDNSTNVTIAGEDYLSLSGQEITANNIDLTDNVTGTLPVANGGTGVVSLTENSILTGNGTNGIVPESALTFTSPLTDTSTLVVGWPNSEAAEVSKAPASGVNIAGGKLILTAGAATGNSAGGSIEFHSSVAGSSGSTVQSTTEIATIDKDGNLSIDGDLTVKGNDIKDDDGTVCITFDSSGNTTIANTLNASVTGDVTGNVSGSSGSCTGNAATATALAAGNQTIDGDVTIGADQAGHDFTLHGATTQYSKLKWDSSEDFLKFSDQAKIVFGGGAAVTDFDSSIQADGSNLVISNDAGNIQIGDTVEITGDLTVSGDLSIGNDAEITSVGSMVFRIDSDANESSQKFTWKHNTNTTIAEINEKGQYIIYGDDNDDPTLILNQNNNTDSAGSPRLEFFRNTLQPDNNELGEIVFKCRHQYGSENEFAKIIGIVEDTTFSERGGAVKIQVASHDGEIVDGLIVEDGDAEDEVDVTIANGSSSLTTVSGNLNVTTNIELGHASDTTIARTAAGTASIEGKEIVTINKQKNIHSYAYHYSGTSAHFIPMSGATTSDSTGLSASSYHLMQVMPFDGRVVRIAVFNQTTTTRTDLFEMYIDGDDSDPVADQRGTDLSFTSAQKGNGDCNTDWTFSKGEAIAIRRTPSAAVNGTTITVVFEFDMTT